MVCERASRSRRIEQRRTAGLVWEEHTSVRHAHAATHDAARQVQGVDQRSVLRSAVRSEGGQLPKFAESARFPVFPSQIKRFLAS
jgi:hypothetical protein